MQQPGGAGADRADTATAAMVWHVSAASWQLELRSAVVAVATAVVPSAVVVVAAAAAVAAAVVVAFAAGAARATWLWAWTRQRASIISYPPFHYCCHRA